MDAAYTWTFMVYIEFKPLLNTLAWWWPNEVGVQDLAWSVGCVLWGNAFLVHCLSLLRNINRYWQIV